MTAQEACSWAVTYMIRGKMMSVVSVSREFPQPIYNYIVSRLF